MKVIKLIRNIYLGCILFIITILAVFLVSSLFSKTSYTKTFGYSFFEVKSYSMYPVLDKGDLVVVKELDDSKYEEGMIITYIKQTDKVPTTHKIVKIEGNIITTRGINEETNNSDDEPFDVSCIIGEVVYIWGSYDEVKSFVTNPLGIIIILLCGFFVIEGLNYLEKKVTKKE